MYSNLIAALWEWAATQLIVVSPFLCYSAKGLANPAPHGSWHAELLMLTVAISGVSSVGMVARFATGRIPSGAFKPQDLLIVALGLLTFLLAGVFYGQLSPDGGEGPGAMVPVTLLAVACATSLYLDLTMASHRRLEKDQTTDVQ